MLPLVVQVERTTEQTADTLAFEKSPVRIGRNGLNDLQLDEPFVSQWHAVIRFSESRTSYVDLGSKNRTVINGKPLERNVEVTIDVHSDIRIGSLRLHALRAAAPRELFGRRRKSAFGQPASVQEDDHAHPPTMLLDMPGIQAELARKRQGKQLTAIGLTPPPGAGGPTPVADEEAVLAREYARLQAQRALLVTAAQRLVERSAPDARAARLAQLQQRYPDLLPSSEGRASQAPGRPSPADGSPDMGGWLQRLTGGLLDSRTTRTQLSPTMERAGAVLEVFSQAFVELLRGQAQFCIDMALEHRIDDSLRDVIDDPRALLAYLLNSDDDDSARLTELSRALADFALHQVGLVSATVEGGRKLMQILAPEPLANVQDPPPDSPALAHYHAQASLWPLAARKLWRRYLAHHYNLADGDGFVRELFGREFARRYYSVTGGSGSDS